MSGKKKDSQDKENKKSTCPIYFYNFNHKYSVDEPLAVSDVVLLCQKLRKSVGWKSFYRNGMLTEDERMIQWGNGFASHDNKYIIDENKVTEYSGLKIKRFDMIYLSFLNIIFMNPKSLLNKLFGYNENRGGAVFINFYPSNLGKANEKIEGKYVIHVGASKKKHLEYAKKCLEDIVKR